MDDKQTIVGLLEAIDICSWRRTFNRSEPSIWHSDKTRKLAGSKAPQKIAGLLKSRGVQLEFVLDEGGFISTGMVPGVRAPVAMIGTSEKGYLSLQLVVDGPGGHSSVPPPESNIGVLAEAIRKIEKHPMPAHMNGPMGEFLEYAGDSASLPLRTVYKNMWLFSPAVKLLLESSPDTNATLRTTAAATIIQAGTKDNVMPSYARAVVNFRLLPGDTVASVTEYIRQVSNDPRVKLQPIEGEPPSDPSPQSSPDSSDFKLMQKRLRKCIRRRWPRPLSL